MKRIATTYKVSRAFTGSLSECAAVDGLDSYGDWFTVEYCDSLAQAHARCFELKAALRAE